MFPIDAKLNELVRLGRERGYLTYEQFNAVLPEDLTPDALDRILHILEENGVELIDDDKPDRSVEPECRKPEPRIWRVARFVQSPDLALWLRELGIEFTDCAARFEDGRLFEAQLIVAGERGIATWRQLREAAPARGLWPLITGRAFHAQLPISDEGDVPVPDADGVVEYISPAETRADALRLIEEANAIDPDPRSFRRCRGQTWIESDPFAGDLSSGPVVAPDETAAWAAAVPLFRGCADTWGTPYPYVRIDLLPVTQPWEVLAYRPHGGWNEVPYPEEMVVMYRSWYERYGAELVLVSEDGATEEVYVPQPPATREDALRLLQDFACFGEVSIWNHPPDGRKRGLDLLRTSHYWYFWWD